MSLRSFIAFACPVPFVVWIFGVSPRQEIFTNGTVRCAKSFQPAVAAEVAGTKNH
jgi:hypothetical protein